MPAIIARARRAAAPAAEVLGIYGPAIALDYLNNYQIGGTNGAGLQQVSYRFKADYTGDLSSVRMYVIGTSAGAGYGAGTGGTIRLELCADSSGTPGSVIATATDKTGIASSAAVIWSFPSPGVVAAGTFYHLLFRNVDGSPSVNYVSVDGCAADPASMEPYQPKYPDNEWSQLLKQGSGAWFHDETHSYLTTPIADLTIDEAEDTQHQGMGYMEAHGYGTNDDYIDGTKKLRQRMTPASSITVRAIGYRMARYTGTGNLTVELQDSGGTPIATKVVTGTDHILETDQSASTGNWTEVQLDEDVVLTGGNLHFLEFRCSGGTGYFTHTMRKGSGTTGYAAVTSFEDGYAEAYDGASWEGAHSRFDGAVWTFLDISCYLVTVS